MKCLEEIKYHDIVPCLGERQHIWALVLTETDQDGMGGLLLLFKKFVLLKDVGLFLSNLKLHGSMT